MIFRLKFEVLEFLSHFPLCVRHLPPYWLCDICFIICSATKQFKAKENTTHTQIHTNNAIHWTIAERWFVCGHRISLHIFTSNNIYASNDDHTSIYNEISNKFLLWLVGTSTFTIWMLDLSFDHVAVFCKRSFRWTFSMKEKCINISLFILSFFCLLFLYKAYYIHEHIEKTIIFFLQNQVHMLLWTEKQHETLNENTQWDVILSLSFASNIKSKWECIGAFFMVRLNCFFYSLSKDIVWNGMKYYV